MYQTENQKSGDTFTAEFSPSVKVHAGAYRFGEGLLYDEMRNTVSVDTADRIEAGNQRPVTSNAVYVEVGNIEALLKTL